MLTMHHAMTFVTDKYFFYSVNKVINTVHYFTLHVPDIHFVCTSVLNSVFVFG